MLAEKTRFLKQTDGQTNISNCNIATNDTRGDHRKKRKYEVYYNRGIILMVKSWIKDILFQKNEVKNDA